MATPEVSVQLYSVHKPLEADLDGTLGRLADIGLRYVEAFDFVRRADALKTAFDRYGLSAPTGHAILIEDRVDTPDGLLTVPPAEETFAAAASLGVSIVIDGKSALEVFADLLDPTVALEVDLYWAAAGGHNPADLLRRLGDRVQAVHVKDGPMRPGISTAELPTDQAPAGQGDVPLAAALAAGNNIGYAVIEFDHYEGDIFDGIAQSYAFIGSTLGASR